MAALKLVGMSALLTLLVWVSADQLLTESTTVRITFKPVAPPGESYVISPVEAAPQTFEVLLRGPQQVIAGLRERRSRTVSLTVEARTTGRISINVIDALRKEPSRFSGATVARVVPEYLEVQVDREVVQSVPVWVDPGSLDYDLPPTVEPDHVEVTISESRLNAIPAERRRVVVRAENLLRNRRKGELLSFDVPLEADVDGVKVRRVAPDHVALRANVRELRVTRTIAAVPLRFTGSVNLWHEFDIELRDSATLLTRPIAVKGPAETVAQLVAGDIKVTGLITLNRGDTLTTGGYRIRKPVFAGLPPDVELADPDAIAPVEFRLVRRDAK